MGGHIYGSGFGPMRPLPPMPQMESKGDTLFLFHANRLLAVNYETCDIKAITSPESLKTEKEPPA
jgi:hypothetical protein